MSCWWHQLFHDAQPHFNPNFNPNFNPYTNPYPAGPAGQNGTQQFAKLQDSQLFEVAKTQAARGFWKQYYNKENIKESTRRLITNLPAIVKEAVGILLNIQKQYGYNPEETVGAIKRHLWKNQMVSKNPAMRMFIAAFGIASILIEVNAGASQNPSTDTKTPQTPKTPQGSQRASRRTVVFTWPRGYQNAQGTVPASSWQPNVPTAFPAWPVPYATPAPAPTQKAKTKEERSNELVDLLEAYNKQLEEYNHHHKAAQREFEELFRESPSPDDSKQYTNEWAARSDYY